MLLWNLSWHGQGHNQGRGSFGMCVCVCGRGVYVGIPNRDTLFWDGYKIFHRGSMN